MKPINKVKAPFELKEYNGFLNEKFSTKKRFVILKNGVFYIDEHFSLKQSIQIFKNLKT